MGIRLTPQEHDFVVRAEGLCITGAVTDAEFAVLRRALDDHGVLILPGQPMDDEVQIAFSGQWGPMEPTRGANPASGTPFARQSNLDMGSGEIIPAQDRRMAYQVGNYQWHADSTFKPQPSLCSILSARVVPPEGGDTEFVSTRRAYESLPEGRRAELLGLVVEHDFGYSRGRVGFRFTPEEAANYPPARHPLVQTNPVTGRRSLLIGAHASHIVGWPLDEGRALLEELLALATVPEAIYSHRWSDGDVVIWDNRSVLHRATAYDSQRHRRLMQRTTIGNPDILRTPDYLGLRGDEGGHEHQERGSGT